MKTKPYPPYEERPMVAGEPAAAYQRTDPATYRTSHSSKCGCTQEEVPQYQLTPYQIEVLQRSEEDSKAGRVLSHEEVMRKIDELEAEWLRPMTMEQLHQWMDEAEAEIEAGEVMTSEEVFAYMESKYPWLCK